MLLACFLYQRFYQLDEERYDEICAKLAENKKE
jgi:Na+/melibiose symporter-like transporter